MEEIRSHGAPLTPRLAAAFAAVARESFVAAGFQRRDGSWARPGSAGFLEAVYRDDVLITKVNGGVPVSSSSQPSLMAIMLDALDVRPGDRVLEIGAGTGYNAALLAHRLGDDCVTTVDLEPEITEAARRHLAAAGYHPAVVTGDGARGAPERAPFDRIIATCTLSSVPVAWLPQCRPGARILSPLATGLIALTVRDAGHAEGRFLHTPAFFVPLRGASRHEEGFVEWSGVPRRARESDLFRFLLTLTRDTLEPRVAYALWEREGRPRRERYGITVSGEREWAWLDDPEGPYTWPLR